MVKQDIKRHYVDHDRQRTTSFKYTFCVNNTVKVVCRQFLLSTLNITEKLLRFTRDNMVDSFTSKIDSRGKKSAINKTPEDLINSVDAFIEKLPAVPSHYCRSSSTKKYIGSEFQSLEHVYRIYVDYCKSNNKTAVSSAIFKKRWQSKYNISIHVPKKDKCTFCEGLKNIEIVTPEEKVNHEKYV